MFMLMMSAQLIFKQCLIIGVPVFLKFPNLKSAID